MTGTCAPLALRAVAGTVFFMHGGQKLLGWFGGEGLPATAESFAIMGFTPGIVWASLAAGTECVGGIALVCGACTRLAALGLAITMGVAIATVHWSHGFFAEHGGFEYPLVLLVICLVLFLRGPGPLSFDSFRKPKPTLK
jgi:putative oxidoreductase